jgi:hypothetical protein
MVPCRPFSWASAQSELDDTDGRGTCSANPDEDGPESYDVNLSPDGKHRCECLGFLRWGHCKHVNGLAVLVEGGKL